MARPRTFDEAEVLEGAVAIFRERGYEGTSIPRLTKGLGICRQSLYAAFGDKRGLYLRALERWGEREVSAKLELLEREEESPLESLRTLIRGFAAYATTCPNEGCFTVTALVETRDDPEALEVVERQIERLERGFEATLERARQAGELIPEARPARLARTLTISCNGIGLLTRLPSSGPRVADAVSVLLELINSYAAEPTTS
jgi:TetR/AcrR family transcriptional regulator, transcriptional repressor for nem operon